jgi:CYTH domain-containing protein
MAEDDSTTEQKRKSTASSDRAIEKLAEARVLLDAEDAFTADSVGYLHTVLCQIGLPRSPIKERVWMRANGGVGLRVAAGAIYDSKEWIEQPVPQGQYARLVLADISTHAVRYKTRHVPMEDSVSAYMRRRLQVAVSGGKKGTYTAFKREAQALAAAEVSLSLPLADGGRMQTKAPPIETFKAWMVDDGPQQALWPCELVLDAKFYESLRNHATPIDMRAYRSLGESCLSMDIYVWLANRLPRLKGPQDLYWSALASQFGGYTDVARFRKEFLKRLKEVKAVYPDAHVEEVKGRRGEVGGKLVLKPSMPPVPRVGVVVPASIGARCEFGAPLEEAGGSEVRSSLEMHGEHKPRRRRPSEALRVRIEQLRGWLKIVPSTHRHRERWEREIKSAEAQLAGIEPGNVD